MAAWVFSADFGEHGLGDLHVQLDELLDAFEGLVGETEEGFDVGLLGSHHLFGVKFMVNLQ
jgi:hypothetical protein